MRFPAVLALVATSLAACGKMSTGTDPNPFAHDVSIVLNAQTKGANAFSPATLTISLASQTKVTWYNADFNSASYGGNSGTTHKIVSDDGVTFSSNNIGIQGLFVATLNTPGNFPYHCAIHPTMTGTLVVNP